MQNSQNIRLSLPSKGRLESDALDFLSAAGLRVFKPNPRQYQAEVPALPELGVIFQRPGDIVVSVRQGSIDFGITGLDAIEEKRGDNGDILILHDALGFVGVIAQEVHRFAHFGDAVAPGLERFLDQQRAERGHLLFHAVGSAAQDGRA